MFNMIMFTVAGAEDARRGGGGSRMTKKGSIRRWKKKKIIKGKNGKKIRRKKIKTGMLHHKISKQGRGALFYFVQGGGSANETRVEYTPLEDALFLSHGEPIRG